MTTRTIKPFAEPRYTMFDNDLLDYVMPRISANAWKIVTLTIRKTWGWKDKVSPTGRKQWDRISYSQFREGTGIKSDATINRALNECLDRGYLLRRPSLNGGEQDYDYSLNTSLEIEVEEDEGTSTETVEVTSTETVGVSPPTSTETVDTNKLLKEKGKERQPSPFSEELRGKDFLEIAALAANGNGREEVEPGAMIAEHVAAVIGMETPPEWKYRENWLEPSLAIWKEARAAGLDISQVKSALNSIFLENPWMAEKVKTPNGFYNSFREYVHKHRAATSLAQAREVERAQNAALVQASLAAAGLA